MGLFSPLPLGWPVPWVDEPAGGVWGRGGTDRATWRGGRIQSQREKVSREIASNKSTHPRGHASRGLSLALRGHMGREREAGGREGEAERAQLCSAGGDTLFIWQSPSMREILSQAVEVVPQDVFQLQARESQKGLQGSGGNRTSAHGKIRQVSLSVLRFRKGLFLSEQMISLGIQAGLCGGTQDSHSSTA